MSFFDILSIQVYSISKYYTHNKTCKTKNQQGHIDKGTITNEEVNHPQTIANTHIATIANNRKQQHVDSIYQ